MCSFCHAFSLADKTRDKSHGDPVSACAKTIVRAPVWSFYTIPGSGSVPRHLHSLSYWVYLWFYHALVLVWFRLTDMICPLSPCAASAHSMTADSCGYPTPVLMRVVHTDPGPMPTWLQGTLVRLGCLSVSLSLFPSFFVASLGIYKLVVWIRDVFELSSRHWTLYPRGYYIMEYINIKGLSNLKLSLRDS